MGCIIMLLAGFIYTTGKVVDIIHRRGAFGVARFDLSGNARASTRGTSNSIGSTLEPNIVKYHSNYQIVMLVVL